MSFEIPKEYGKISTSIGMFFVSRQELNTFRLVYTENTYRRQIVSFTDLFGDLVTLMIEDVNGMYSCSKASVKKEHELSDSFDEFEKECCPNKWE